MNFLQIFIRQLGDLRLCKAFTNDNLTKWNHTIIVFCTNNAKFSCLQNVQRIILKFLKVTVCKLNDVEFHKFSNVDNSGERRC